MTSDLTNPLSWEDGWQPNIHGWSLFVYFLLQTCWQMKVPKMLCDEQYCDPHSAVFSAVKSPEDLWKCSWIHNNNVFLFFKKVFYQHLAANERYGPSLLNFPSSPDQHSWVLCCYGDSHMGSVVAVCFAGANAVLFGRSQAARWEPAWWAGWGVRHWGWPHPVCAGTQPALSSSQAGPQQAWSDRKI